MLLGHIIENTALRHPDQAAIIAEDSRLSFGELLDRMNRIICGLQSLADPGSRIAVLAHNRSEVIELQHAIPTAGMICVFVNQRLSSREIQYILRNSRTSVVAVSGEFEQPIINMMDDLPDLQAVIALDESGSSLSSVDYVVPFEQLITSDDASPPSDHVSPNQPAWLVYTSGTTGRPKGAMLSHRNIIAAIANTLGGAPSEPFGRFLNPFSLSHIAAYAVPTQFANKSTVVIQRGFDPKEYLRAIQDMEITASSIAPAMLGLILSRPELEQYETSSLRHIAYGSSSITPALLRRAMNRFKNAEFFQAFGMTELAGNVGWMDHSWHLKGLDRPEILSASALAAPFAGIRIADEENQPVKNGVVGEIQVRADQVMLGYWENEEATREAFTGEWYKTGDLGRISDEGLLYIVDRLKDMIVTGGLNVYSREVEDVLAEHPQIQDVAVIGLPDEMWGESVCAVVVTRTEKTLSDSDVITFAKENLASYKKPKYVIFEDALPRNANGKVLKRELRKRYAQLTKHGQAAAREVDEKGTRL